MNHLEAEVVVVGAGLAGLTAARGLAANGRDVVVLEARERVGGRTLNHAIGDGKVVELGAQWVGPTQDRILALLGELGIETFPTWTAGENLFERTGEVRRYRGTIPRLNPVGLAEMAVTLARFNRLAKRVPPAAPWTAPEAGQAGFDDVRDLGPAHGPHRRRPRPDAARGAGRLGGRGTGPLAAPRALLRRVGGIDRDPPRHRGRGAAGPDRRRHADHLGADRGRPRRIRGARRAGPRRSPPRRRGRGRRRRRDRLRGAGDLRDRAAARGPDRLRPAAAGDPRRPQPADGDGERRQVHGDLRRAVLARRRPLGPGGELRRAGLGRPSTTPRPTARRGSCSPSSRAERHGGRAGLTRPNGERSSSAA